LTGNFKAFIDVYNGICIYSGASAIVECKADYKFDISDSKYYYVCDCSCNDAPVYYEEIATPLTYKAFGNQL
jgi:hypothetical protein